MKDRKNHGKRIPVLDGESLTEIDIPEGTQEIKYAFDPRVWCSDSGTISIPRPKPKVKRLQWLMKRKFDGMFYLSAYYAVNEVPVCGKAVTAIRPLSETMIEVEDE
jgi:hypothetical protein